jgi:ferritin-like metal-binding protein YciE
MRLESLHELFLNELHDVYDAENQLIKALPKMADLANSPELKSGIQAHLQQTRNQARRLEQILEDLGEKVKGKKCLGIRGIVEEGEELANHNGDPAALDAGIIASAQKVEHYEIAAYGTLCAWARIMGHDRELELLEQTLEEEKETDEKLTELAERMINVDAVRAAGSQMRRER